MSLYTLDIQVPRETSGHVLHVFQPEIPNGLEVVSSNVLYSDLNTTYYRLELFCSGHDRDWLVDLIEANFKKVTYKLREDLSLYDRPLFEMSPRKSIDTRRSFMATSPATLRAAQEYFFRDPENVRIPPARNRVGLLSNGGVHEFPARMSLALERDAFLINKHTNLQTFPLWIQSRHEEEFLKAAVALAPNFSMLRIGGFARDDALDMRDRLADQLDIPVILSEYVETAGLITAVLKNAARIFQLDLVGGNAAIVGLGPAGHGVADLLVKLGLHRVFGIDHDPRQLARFEKGPGIASSLDHVYENADLIIISPDYPTRLHEERLRRDQLVLSFTPGALDVELAEKNGAHVFQGYPPHPVFIMPGLLGAIQKQGVKRVEADHILRVVETLELRSGESNFLPAPSAELIRSQINMVFA